MTTEGRELSETRNRLAFSARKFATLVAEPSCLGGEGPAAAGCILQKASLLVCLYLGVSGFTL